MTKRIPEPDPPPQAEAVVSGGTDVELEEYARHRDPAVRAALVVKYRPLVLRMARHLARRVPGHVEQADLVSAGVVGLFDALDRFEPGRGKPFDAYASTRIRGAMLDEVRALGVMPRAFWAKRRAADRAAAAVDGPGGGGRGTGDIASAAGLSAAELNEVWASPITDPAVLETLSVADAEAYGFATNRDPEQVAVDTDARDRLRLALDRLPDRAYRLIDWYYRKELTFTQIADRLGVTVTRVTQLHALALQELRRRL